MTFTHHFITFYSLLRKEIGRFLRIWKQTLLPPAITQSLYFLIFGSFIGSQLNPINGLNYMSFILPGLIMMGVINSSYANISSSFFGAKFHRNIEELLVSPTAIPTIILGYTTASLLRGVLVGIIIFLVSIPFQAPTIHSFIIILVCIVFTAMIFALAGLLNAIFSENFDSLSVIPTFVIMPLTYFGGVFYSINDLPGIWQALSKFNPIVYMIDSFRYGFYGQSDLNLYFSFSILTIFFIVLFVSNWFVLHKGYGLKS